MTILAIPQGAQDVHVQVPVVPAPVRSPSCLGGTALATVGASPLRRAVTAAADEPERLTDLGMPLSGAQRVAGDAFLKHHVSVDVHCHAGRFFLEGLPPDTAAARALGLPLRIRRSKN